MSRGRVLVISDLWLPFPGGAERLMFNLARDLDRRGFRVDVLTSYARAQRFDGPPVEFVSIGVSLFRDAGARDLVAYVANVAPDVILTHHYFAFEFERELVETGIPLVQVVLNGHRIPEAAMAVFISYAVRAREEMNPRAQDMTIVPLAFDDVVASTHGDAVGFIKPLHHKGVDVVYEIARRMPDRRFVILRGEWQDSETIVELPNVELMDPVDDIRDFYARCRVVIVPSLSEDAGTVGQECALNGIPCISSNAGGLPETNAGGQILTTHDPAVWAATIKLLDDDEIYAAFVESQRKLTPTGQPELLREFARRVELLARSAP